MSLSTGRRACAYVGLSALLVAGCAHIPGRKAPPDKPAALTPANTTPPERQHYIMELLGAGKRDQARVEAQKLVEEQPTNTEATTLLNEIDADPQVLLGGQNTPYTVQPGETLVTLADRFLGDSNLFYALARYNNIDTPNDVAPGQTILIPSASHGARADHADRDDHPEHGDRPVHAEHREPAPPVLRRREEPPPEPKKASSAPAEAQPATPAHDPARANALRSQALVEMNKGAIDRAVSLLREASHLDPDSGPINADLARALRIQGATHR
ncbi:LysM peptidoglycan-binding domain-containing protein [Caulobacter sp. S45]|uniref:LysM peptidoglycan-binding domain-containing protein n=1 Tax=Caulobacter sp. S45 TaxID=1641861 RepID=UPI001576ED7F|nr:LysM peptidoglycan-binding domain-containing protein [Caulobacter sp. S45]